MNRLVLINVSIGLILVWQVNNNMETLTKSTLVQFFNFLSNVILLRNSHNDQLSLPLYTLILYIMVFFKSAFFNVIQFQSFIILAYHSECILHF